MAVSRHGVVAGPQPVGKRSEAASLAELLNMILDKGIVIDGWARVSIHAWTRVSVLGLELLTIEARMVVTSVGTYLRYADAMARLTPAAPPPWQRAVSGGDSEHDRVLEGEVLRALSEHSATLPPASA
jgi:gas vesicle structural protein